MPTDINSRIGPRRLPMAFLLAAVLALPPGLAASPTGLSFLVLGDWGKGNAGQREVAAALGDFAGTSQARFIITTGDNFYPDGVSGVNDPTWQGVFEDVYTAPALNIPWYPVLGNHDYRGNEEAQIQYSRSSSRWDLPARFYKHSEQIDAKQRVEFYFLDTTEMVRAFRWPHWLWPFENVQLAWLENELAASNATWKIVIGHHPVMSGGSHGQTRSLADKLQTLFERHGVNAYICGHDHALEHIVAHGVHYFVVGSSAEVKEVQPIEGTQQVSARLGFMAVQLEQDAMQASFVDATGEAFYLTSIRNR